MANQHLNLLLLLLLLLLVVSTTSTNGIPWDNLFNGWPPIKDVNDPKVQAMAKFAISEHNKQSGDDLVYVKVVSGGSRPRRFQPGRDYQLEIEAIDDFVNYNTYEAVVWNNPDQNRMELVSFDLKS